MKQNIFILTLLFAMISVTVYSQSLTLTRKYTLEPVHNDDTIVLKFPITQYMAWDSILVNNVTTHPVNMMIKKTQRRIVPGTSNTFCWDLCVDSSVYVFGPNVLEANASAPSFSSDYDPDGETGISVIRYTFYIQETPSDSICFNIKFMHPLDIGIDEMYKNYLFTNAYPNPANSKTSINYNYSAAVNEASVVVIDLLGKEVKAIPLTDIKGKVTVNTSGFSNGIYFYSLVLNGKKVSTRKLIVNH